MTSNPIKDFHKWVNGSNMEPLTRLHELLHTGEYAYPLELLMSVTHEERIKLERYLYETVAKRRLVSAVDILYDSLSELPTAEQAMIKNCAQLLEKASDQLYRRATQ